MRYRIILILTIIIVNTGSLISQVNSETQNYVPPLDMPMILSGTYGELRNNHFHSGIDLKTGGTEGKKVYAIADGYVARINISAAGYGKALYIMHTNGKMSVYCHLSGLNSFIDSYLKKEQYRLELFEVDLYPPAFCLPVKKGEVVAFTGNSGSSAGPHLHFELRDSSYNQTYNPMLGFAFNDQVPPYINLLKIYPANTGSLINNKNDELTLTVIGKGKNHKIMSKTTPELSGDVYFGIQAFDAFNEGKNINGIYAVKLYIDTTLLFAYDFASFRFDQTRYLNSFIDYKVQQSKKIQRSFIEPNNKLDIYKIARDSGVFCFNENRNYTITYQVSDFNNNTAELKFVVRGKKPNPNSQSKPVTSSGTTPFYFTKDNTFTSENIVFEVPGLALYDNINFKYKLIARSKGYYSDVHVLHDESIPMHTYCRLLIKPIEMPDNLKEKCVIVQVKNSGDVKSVGGEWEKGFVACNIRSFGKYAVRIDTLKPGIQPVNIFNNKKITTQREIKVKIWDNLSGIKSYSGKINGNWVLMEYDTKTNLLTYIFDEHLQKGLNKFEIVVSDKKDNRAFYQATLIY